MDPSDFKINSTVHFTFILPCIVIDFFLNNQADALIITILFCYKTLYVSGILSFHLQAFSAVHSALISFMQIIKNLHETYQCRMYSRKLLMMGKEDARNM
jgi:predicted permease